MSDLLFASQASFQHAFTTGLSALLQKGGLGPFILVCANASFDKRVEAATSAGLAELFKSLSAEYVTALANGTPIQAVEEDLLVFLKLHTVGFARLQATETRQVGPWEIQFNQLRSFRPRRISAQLAQSLHLPFDEAGFHFNKPFMQKEAFWSGKLSGRHATLYYNKYPFADFHGLLVPDRESCLPQYLAETRHHYVWQVTQDLSSTLDGVAFGYNSLGAFASVNHLHFQMFIKPSGLTVMNKCWMHNGGDIPYPASCAAFETPSEAWAYLCDLHEKNISYNMLYSRGRAYVFPRKKQGSYSQPDWTSGFAWMEMAGGMITFNRDRYLALDEDVIVQELGKLAVSA